MSVYKLENRDPIVPLFASWDETLIWSCLQGCMGEAFADNINEPKSAMIVAADFTFVSGNVEPELLRQLHALCGQKYMAVVPRNDAWARAIENVFKEKATPLIRYSTRKDINNFEEEILQTFVNRLPDGYSLKQIDETLYQEALSMDWSKYLCSNYSTYEVYRRHGLGFVVRKGKDLVCGASSYAHYNGGLEIEIDTREDERRKGLALSCASKLILTCLKRSLYPSWDAHNKASLALAEKLGYVFDEEYLVYDVCFK